MKNNPKNNSATIRELQELIMDFNCLRGWHLGQGFNPKNLASSVVIEAGELLEHFQWLSEKEVREIKDDPRKLRAVGLEAADVLIYLLKFAKALNLDLSAEVVKKMRINERRFRLRKK